VKKLYICGSGGHALVCADVAYRCGYKEVEFIDDFKDEFKSLADIPKDETTPFFVAIGNNHIRAKVVQDIQIKGFELVSLIDPSAVIASSVTIKEATLVMPNVVVNAKARIGEGVILNTASVIEHENIIEDYVHISPKVALAGNVIIKENTHIGIGSVSIQGITVGKNSIIGAGSVIVQNIDDNVKAYGNPCKVIEGI